MPEETIPEPGAPQVWTKPIPAGVPPTAFWGEDDLLYHKIDTMTEGGTVHKDSIRRLAQNMDEARELRIDYFHPTLGLIWEGYKLAKDRTPEDRMRDTTYSRMRPGVTAPF
jgi:hypothetical protein